VAKREKNETNVFTLLITAVLSTVLLACASTKDIFPGSGDDEFLKSAMFQQAVENINRNEKRYLQERNSISFYLDRGMASYYAGSYESSLADLQEADRLIEEAYTLDISDYMEAFFKNKVKKVQYPGEDYEYIYINIFNALSYFNLGDMEKALVEIRMSNAKLQYLAEDYFTKERFWKEQIDGFIGIPANINIGNSALARYLSALFWRGEGYLDDAGIDAQEAVKAFAEYPDLYNFPLPSVLVQRAGGGCEETSIPSNLARLNVLGFTGLSPVKQIPMDNYFWYRITEDEYLYGGRYIRETDTPRDEKVQVDAETLRPILAAFAELCGRTNYTISYENNGDKKAFHNVMVLQQMLRDLYVNDEINADLEQITESMNDVLFGYRREGQTTINLNSWARMARTLLIKIYGNEERNLGYRMADGILEGDVHFLDPLNYDETDNALIDLKNRGIRLRMRAAPVTRIEAAVDNNQTFSLELIEDIGTIVESLYERRQLMRKASMFQALQGSNLRRLAEANDWSRFYATTAASYTATYFSNLARTWVFTFFTLPAAMFTSKSSMDARIARRVGKEMGGFDDRMGRYLPGKAYAGGINLAPGVYSMTISYYNGVNLIHSERHENVNVKTGQLNLVTSYSF
jgi:tetratricopeptide (TPR) repeat protein